MNNRFHLKHVAIFWIADSLAAILLAAALAFGVSAVSGRGSLDGAQWPEIWLAIAGIGIAAMLRALLLIASADSGEVAAKRAKSVWRSRIFPHILTSAPAQQWMLGETVADAVDRIEDLGGYHARFLPLRRAAVVAPLLVAAAACVGSWVAGAIMLATLIPFAMGMALAGTAAARASARQMEALSRLSGVFVDRIRALPVITSFGAEDRVSRHLADSTQDVATRTLAVLKVAFLSSAVIEFFAALSVALVALYCGFNLLGLLPFPAPETLSLGEALFVLVLAPEFYLPMRRLAAAYHDKQVGEAAIERLEQIAPPSAPCITPPMVAAPMLRFDQVVVDYGETKIGPFSLDVPAGSHVVLRGATGVGKSSLLHALVGLAPLQSGRILVNDQDAHGTLLSGQIGWVGQSVALVAASLADNIRLSRPDADDSQVMQAAQRAGLGMLVAARAEGLDLWLDHRGSGLSGGERRRVGIARALLKDAPLWLLDEPTADLDAVSAGQIAQILREATVGRTLLMVTHSDDLAQIADQQVVLT